ncbi:CDP-glycerol glycerophosphotransferase family protein [Leucobacter sp. cx-42]|uniref:CDP-glycerol glycerophosphotransferase family protein n=1 Tax=unclassified Leucobacter TaxID=2621730 RepID=UPI00165E0FA7|nr:MULTISPECIES: CDP-glycerol glycerophosphotransferase family protein [unclassified Leucobacter]MBC9953362.1 CDP-glycerol glycerophosphotransferase family protein [Leucobacter sp. cx-42]
MSKTKILLLSNRDSDNVGDQLVEANMVSLVAGVMKNLDYHEDTFVIDSRSFDIVPPSATTTSEDATLARLRTAVSGAKVVLIVGASRRDGIDDDLELRTAKTLEVANELNVPVILFGISAPCFDESNEVLVRLKAALSLPCVRHISTFEEDASLDEYLEDSQLSAVKTSDPTVFTDVVFRKRPAPVAPLPEMKRTPLSVTRSVLRRVPVPVSIKSRVKIQLKKMMGQDVVHSPAPEPPVVASIEVKPTKPKRIGLLVARANLFNEQGIAFTENQQRQLWLKTISTLSARGYEVRLFTTGHVADEAFLEAMVRGELIPPSMAAVVINTPEGLLGELKQCAGVISFSAHASIASYALKIPSVGLAWNPEIRDFYQSIGYGHRALEHGKWRADEVVTAIEKALDKGVKKDEKLLQNVYEWLFFAFKDVTGTTAEAMLSLGELKTELPIFAGTSSKEYQLKARRKLRLAYAGFPQMEDVRNGEQEYLRFSMEEPVDPTVVFYESMSGERVNDNPLAIFEYLHAHPEYGNFTHVWSVGKDVEIPERYKEADNVIFVRLGSIEFQKYLATAGHIVRNVGVPSYFVRREGQRFLNTWHGVPYKALGRETNNARFGAPTTIENFFKATHLVTPCSFMTGKILAAYSAVGASTAVIGETGYPRVDVTVNTEEARKSEIRKLIGLPVDGTSQSRRPVVLYAPTWRSNGDGTSSDHSELTNALSALADVDAEILFRGHHRVTRLLGSNAIGGQLGEILVPPQSISTNELLSVVDVLITDYSSIFFDFLPTGKPIVQYLYDIEEYQSARGLYLGVDELPGSIAMNLEELRAAVSEASELVRAFDQGAANAVLPLQGDRYAAAQLRFAPHEDGQATKRVVDFFFKDQLDSELVRSARDDRPTTLFWASRFKKAADAKAFLDRVLEALENEDRQITMVIARDSIMTKADVERLKANAYRLAVVPSAISGPKMLPEEQESFFEFVRGQKLSVDEVRKRLEEDASLLRICDREYRRRLDDAKFDEVILADDLSNFELALAALAGRKKHL